MLKKLPRLYLKTIEFICTVLLALILGSICLQILCRLFTIGQSFTEELARICFCLMVFIGSPLVLAEGSHIAVDILFNALPDSVAKYIQALDYIVVDVVCVFCIIGFNKMISTNTGVTSVAMEWLKMNWIYSTALVSFGLLIVVSSVQFFASLSGKPSLYFINGNEKKYDILDIELDI